MTEEQMLEKDPKFKDYQKIYHPWTIALQPERKFPHLVRLCSDPSSPNVKGISFNDALMSGRNIHSDLLHLFTRLRRIRFFASNDIKKYYNCCFLSTRSSALSGFLWRPMGTNEPLRKCYSRVLQYGIKNANLVAGLCLMRSLKMFSNDEDLINYKSFYPYVDFCSYWYAT